MRSWHSLILLPYHAYIMPSHASPDQMRYDLEAILAKINALEITAKDEFQLSVVKILRALVGGQMHSLDEFGHLKKAIDLLTLEMFKSRSAADSSVPPTP